MYEWMANKTNETARNMIFLLFGGSAAILLVTTLGPEIPFRWVFQMIALVLLTAAIFLVTRYQTKRFIYRIVEDGAGGRDLTVTECAVNGKRAVTVCRVGLGNLSRVTVLDMSDGGKSTQAWREIRREKGKIFDYTADLKPMKSIFLTVREGGEDLRIRLSFDQTLWNILSAEE